MFLNLTAGLGAKRNIPRPRMEYSVGNRVNPSDHVGGRMSCCGNIAHGACGHRSFPVAQRQATTCNASANREYRQLFWIQKVKVVSTKEKRGLSVPRPHALGNR